MVIKPEPGRHVHYIPAGVDDFDMAVTPDQPLAAIVTAVHSNRLVNLAVFDANGKHFSRTSIALQQPGDDAPSERHCRWMPYTLATERARTPQTAA